MDESPVDGQPVAVPDQSGTDESPSAPHRVLCISLDSPAGRERHAAFEAHLNTTIPQHTALLDVQREPGVQLGESKNDRLTGCARAHGNCAKKLLSTADSAVGTIVEDDVQFVSGSAVECWVRNVVPHAQRLGADMVLAGVHGVKAHDNEVLPVDGCTCTPQHHLVRASNMTGFHMYAPLTTRMRDALVATPANTNIDVHIGRKCMPTGAAGALRAYCVTPMIAECRPCMSNIKGTFRDYSSYVQRAARLLEAARNGEASVTTRVRSAAAAAERRSAVPKPPTSARAATPTVAKPPSTVHRPVAVVRTVPRHTGRPAVMRAVHQQAMRQRWAAQARRNAPIVAQRRV